MENEDTKGRSEIDRRSGLDRRKHKDNLSLLEMITLNNLESQCAKIAEWCEKNFMLQKAGFSIKDIPTGKVFNYSCHVQEGILDALAEIFSKTNYTECAAQSKIFYSINKGKLIPYKPEIYSKQSEPAELFIPLIIKNNCFGMLTIISDSTSIQTMTGEESTLLRFIPLISSLIYNTVFEEHTARTTRYLKLYQTVSSSLGYIGDLQELLSTIVNITTAELSCEAVSILLYDEENNELEFYVADGSIGTELKKVRFSANHGIAGQALHTRSVICVNNAKSSPHFYDYIDERYGYDTQSILAAPLISGEQIVGVIEAVNKNAGKFFDREDELILSAIADEVALAVKNARLFDIVVESYCKIKQGMQSCKGCKRPLKSWTPCAMKLEGSK